MVVPVGTLSPHTRRGKPTSVPEKTLFEKIVAREIPADIVHEDEACIAFRDINPVAPTHILVVPKKPITMIEKASPEDGALLGHLVLTAQKVAQSEGLTDGYRLVFNNGNNGGQTVYHIHLHLLGGRALGWPPG